MHGQGDDEHDDRPGRYTGERPFRNQLIDPRDPLLTGRDPRTFANKADKWGDRVFLVPQSVAIASGLKSRTTVIDTHYFPTPRAIAIFFRFQGVNSPVDAAGRMTQGPAIPLAANWFPTPSFNAKVRVRLSLSVDGQVSETEYTNDVSALVQAPLILPRVVLCHKLAIDVECIGGFTELAANSAYCEVWAAPVETVQPVSLIDNRSGDLVGNYTADLSRFASSIVSTDFLFADITRRQFIVHNNSTQRLALAFGGLAPQFTAGAERWTVLLQPGAIYESPIGGFAGVVRGVWDVVDAAGEALVTSVRTP